MTVECEIDSIFKIELIRKWETRNGQMWNDIGSATNHCERKTARLMNAAECALFDQRMLFTFVHNSKKTTRSFDSIENKTEWNEKKNYRIMNNVKRLSAQLAVSIKLFAYECSFSILVFRMLSFIWFYKSQWIMVIIANFNLLFKLLGGHFLHVTNTWQCAACFAKCTRLQFNWSWIE